MTMEAGSCRLSHGATIQGWLIVANKNNNISEQIHYLVENENGACEALSHFFFQRAWALPPLLLSASRRRCRDQGGQEVLDGHAG